MLHVTKSLAMEASHIGHTIARGRIKGATRDWVNKSLAVHGRLLKLLELILIAAAADSCGWGKPVARVSTA